MVMDRGIAVVRWIRFLCLLCGLLGAKSGLAETAWTRTSGPEGGYVYAIASAPGAMYMGVDGSGVYKSLDAGVTWAPSNGNGALDTARIYALAVDPASPATLYAGTDAPNGVYKSTDGGATWNVVNNGFPSAFVQALAIDPGNPQIVYAATYSSIVKSTNGGASWVSTGSGLGDNVRAIVVDRNNSAIVYAATQNGVFKSTNGGGAWSSASAGMSNLNVNTLVPHPVTANVLYAGTGTGLFKSTDAGASWNPSGIDGGILFVAFDPATPATLYAARNGAVHRSVDGGVNWTTGGPAGLGGNTVSTIRAMIAHPSLANTLYVGTQGAGLFRSVDGGTSWSRPNKSVAGVLVRALAISPTAPHAVYAGSYGGGSFRSSDGGASWTLMASGLTNDFVQAFAFDPVTPGTMYAGAAGGLYKSIDGGDHWSTITSGLGNPIVSALVVRPDAPATVYAGTSGGGVFRSVDGGAQWASFGSGLGNLSVRSLVLVPSAPATMYAGTDGSLYRSTDGGATWSALGGGLPSARTPLVAVDPAAPGTLYAIVSDVGIYKSTDGGDHWSSVDTGSAARNASALVVDPLHAGTVYAGIAFGGAVRKSTNGGATWADARSGMYASDIVQAMAASPDEAGVLYAGTNGHAVYKSGNGALSADARLSNLVLDDGSGAVGLSPAFDPATQAYAVTVQAASATVTPTAWITDAVIRVNGVLVGSGSASAPIPLAVGSNALSVAVTSGDGSSSRTYAVTVTRPKITQAIDFPVQGGQTYRAGGTFSVDPPATATSGLAVVYSSLSLPVCTVSGSTVAMLGAGTCTLAANQEGSSDYAAAAQVTRDVAIGPGTNVIAFPPQGGQTYRAGGTFAVDPPATATSGLAVTYGSLTPSVCTVAGATVTMVGAGTCTLAADQAGDANYVAAARVTRDVAIAKASQALDFPAQIPATRAFVPGGTFAIAPLATSVEPNSGNAIAYSSLTTGVCTVVASTVTMVGPGHCRIAADQSGNANYTDAAQATQGVGLVASVVAQPQSTTVAFNTTQAITLGGSDPNPGGPFALTYTIATPPDHGTLGALDANTGALTYTPDRDYVGIDRFTFTVSSANGTSPPATVDIDVVAPQLALAIAGDRQYARYGEVVDYVVTLTNADRTANAVPVIFTLSPGLDAQAARLTCQGMEGGASCMPDASDPLRFLVTLPPNRTLTWLVGVPVRSDATEPVVTLGVAAIGASTVVDTRTLVVFRDGFDAGDSPSAPVLEGAAAAALLDGEALQDVGVPMLPSAAARGVARLVVRDGRREVRVEVRPLGGTFLVRLRERDGRGRERASAWHAARAGAVLTLGSAAPQEASSTVDPQTPLRALVLIGAEATVVLP